MLFPACFNTYVIEAFSCLSVLGLLLCTSVIPTSLLKPISNGMQLFVWSTPDVNPRHSNGPLPNNSKVLSVDQSVVNFPYTLAESFSK